MSGQYEENEFDEDKYDDEIYDEEEEIEPVFTDPFEALTAYLNRARLSPKRIPDTKGYEFSFDFSTGRLHGKVIFRSFGSLLTCYTYYPDVIPQSQRSIAAEFIMRVNPQTYVGSLMMDWDSGQTYHRYILRFDNVDLTFALMKNLIWSSLVTMDEFRLGLAAIVTDGKSADDAIEIMQKQLGLRG